MWRWCRRSPASHAALSWRGKYLAEAPLDSGALESKHCLLLPQVGVGFQRKGSALSVFSWSRGDAGGAGAALGKWLERAGATARALLVLSNLCFLCSPWRVLEDLSEVWSPLWGPCLVLSAQHIPILSCAAGALYHPIPTRGPSVVWGLSPPPWAHLPARSRRTTVDEGCTPLVGGRRLQDLHTLQVQVSLSVLTAGSLPSFSPVQNTRMLPPSWVNKQKYLFLPESKRVLP